MSANDEHARAIEPFASPPSKRFETLRILADAGIDTGVGVAPIIPGLNDDQIPEILTRARDAGANRAFKVLVRLPREVRAIFDERVADALPLRHRRIMNAIDDVRRPEQTASEFGARMVGQGPRWAAIEQLFTAHCRRMGLEQDMEDTVPPPRRRAGPQLPLVF